MRSRCVLVLVCALLWAWPLAAQEQGGSIQGVVKDSSGGVLPGVTVEVSSPSVVGVSTSVTDAEGVYRFPALPPGTYTVTATLQGFQPAKVANATLSLGQNLAINLTLSIAGVSETVQVTGEAPLIDVKQNASFATIQKEVIEKIPKGRDFLSVVKTAPGANDESKAGGIQVDGASGSENRFIIDGMDTTNLQNGTSGKTMLVDFIQEVQVKSSGYNAEFGGATGGVVSAITKSGSNNLRGSAGLYFQSYKFYGDRRTFNSYSPYNTDLAEKDLVNTRTPWTYYSPIADLGGPIVKDKVWYYAGVAYTANLYNLDAIFYQDPSLTTRHFERSTAAYYPNYNLTTQLNNNMRLRFSGSNQRNHERGALPTLDPENRRYLGTDARLAGTLAKGYSRSTFDKNKDGSINQDAYDRRWNKTGSDSTNDVFSGNLDWVLSSQFFLNTTMGYYRTNTWTPVDARGDAIVHAFQASNLAMDIPADFKNPNGYTDNISSNGTLRNIYDRFYVNANATYFKSMAGQHVFKAGIRYERFGNDIYAGNAKPRLNFYWNQTYATTGGDNVTGKYGYYMVNKTGTIGKVASNNYSFWVQDSWTLNDKLTVNAGVRVENELVPSYKDAPDAIDIKFGFRDKIAPRLGFAYDLKGDGKTKVYGSYGWFYDITKLSLPRGAFGGDHWINYYWTLDTYDWKSLSCDEGNSGCAGTFIEQWDARHSSNQPDPILAEYFNRPGMTGVDPELKPVQTGEFTLGLDRELNSTMSLGVRYVHKWLSRTIEDVGIIVPEHGEIYIIGNPGYGDTKIMVPDYPQYLTPKAQRDYDSFEMRLRKRLANRWSAEVSYTYSRLYGNYGGLASSDENGRTDPNINRYFDALYMSYDRNNAAVYGLLATDRPHVIKAQGTYDLPWGTSLGLYAAIMSGTPQSTEVNWNGYPVYAFGRGDMGRMPWYKQVDLQVQHDFRILGDKRLTVQANIDNVFDFTTPTAYYSSQLWRDRISLEEGDDVFFGGPWDPNALVTMLRNLPEPPTIRDQQLYGVYDTFQGTREMRLQVKFAF